MYIVRTIPNNTKRDGNTKAEHDRMYFVKNGTDAGCDHVNVIYGLM